MTRRDLLHAKDVEAFVAFAIETMGWRKDARPLGDYEVLRLRDCGGNLHVGYQRGGTAHVTISGSTIIRAALRFIGEKHKARKREARA